jgi:two-component system response regulator NreC
MTIVASQDHDADGMEQRRLRIFLVDDHAFLREGLKSLIGLQSDMEIVGEAESGDDACQQVSAYAPENRPDIVVMDLSMPGMNGVQATTHLKRLFPDLHILALSMHEDTTYLRALLEAGASGYVLKRSAPQELVNALRSVSTGSTYLDQTLAGKVTADFMRRRSSLRGDVMGNALSEREAEVLRLVAQGYSGKEVAAQLSVSLKTVESYKTRALEKLGIESRADIVRYAALKGWLQDM